MLSTRIPVYAKLVQAVQDLSSAMHKFHKQFNNKAGQLVLQLEATKKRMEGAWMCSRVQNILLELTHSWELWGRFYWPRIPSLLKHPNQHYILSLCDACTITVEGLVTAKVALEDGKENTDDVFTRGQAVQHAGNVCKYCGKDGHWQKECKEPHNNCKGPHCQLWRDHANFNMWPCAFLKRQVGQRGKGKCKHEPEPDAPCKRSVNMEEPIDINMLINDGACLYISD